MTSHRSLVVAIAMALVAVAMPAAAQRASLADRVAALEQRAANPQQTLDLLEQVKQLRNDVQSLRSQVEEMQQANEQARTSMRNQYLDVDGRLQQLESRTATPPSAPAPPAPEAAPRAAAKAPARPAAAKAPAAKPAPAPRAAAGSATPTGAELAAYNAAFDALKAGSYADSARLFTAFLGTYPGGVYAPNAMYWLGESYYGTRNYEQAIGPFSQLLERFPTHDKAPGALLKRGLTRLNLHQDEAARADFEAVVAHYAGTAAARSAADRLVAMGAAP
ncbi:tol-pal system protein YbgF [Cognatilysobacter lacus]|uniref:Cell division coordinator CpoB n=1 Tax=Cognatilysobacter lacus TaxID=1643323 RepID=A0A5D8Z5N0_9GAMM|nr:tol-pal system protein YbgF [Lysobacter lacus]TZF90007.1 tol-pal system protein YbgF [Lysobacter lacus]